MRVLIAGATASGATGAVGSLLVRLLVAAGHKVTGLTRSPAKAELLRQAGATPAVVDAFDKAAVRAAVLAAGLQKRSARRSGSSASPPSSSLTTKRRRCRSPTGIFV